MFWLWVSKGVAVRCCVRLLLSEGLVRPAETTSRWLTHWTGNFFSMWSCLRILTTWQLAYPGARHPRKQGRRCNVSDDLI